MKPIFEEERVFLNEKLNIELPTECWRKASEIYLDCTCEKPLYKFKVQNNNINMTKNNLDLFVEYKQKKIKDLIEIYKDRLNQLEDESVEFIKNYLVDSDFEQIIQSHSGGKDSVLEFHIFNKALEQLKEENIEVYKRVDDCWLVNFANTSNDTADTYKLVKKLPRLNILNPEMGYYQWITQKKKYRTPTRLMRSCCSTYKEGQLTKYYDNNKKILMFTGLRKYESTKRAKYDYVMDYDFNVNIHGKSTMPKTWVTLAPCVEWHDEEVWLYLLKENLEYNKMYNLGFHRCGCLICPYQQDYIDLLIQKYYPNQWKRWINILTTEYKLYAIGNQTKWTLEEWLNGAWKHGTSKEYLITSLKPTQARVEQLASIKGIDNETALKFWNKSCSCGKKLNPSEISMFLKLMGRYDNEEDNRTYLCKSCLCEHLGITKTEYKDKQNEFYRGDCNLF